MWTPKGLGARFPEDRVHIEKYSITFESMPTMATPVIMGTRWFTAFDTPVWDSKTRKWWIARDGNLGTLRGGHAYCLKPPALRDPLSWWQYYDQGYEGACVGFAASRAMSLMNRVRYNARWLYLEAQLVDSWGDTPPEEGTSVRAAIDILRAKGHVPVYRGKDRPVDINHGVLVNRWARSFEQIIECLKAPQLYDVGGVPLLNSWGKDYPHIVYMPLDVLQKLLDMGGEATIFTDR